MEFWTLLCAKEAFRVIKLKLSEPGRWPYEKQALHYGAYVSSADIAVDPTGITRDVRGEIKDLPNGSWHVSVTLEPGKVALPIPVAQVYPIDEINERATQLAKAGVLAFWEPPSDSTFFTAGELTALSLTVMMERAKRWPWQRSAPAVSANVIEVVDKMVNQGFRKADVQEARTRIAKALFGD